MRGMAQAEGARARTREPGHKQRWIERYALRFHSKRHPLAAVGICRSEDSAAIAIRGGNVALEVEGMQTASRELHLDARRLVRLAAGIDHHRLGNDLMTMRWNWRAIKLRWLPAFAWDLMVIAWALLAMTVFHWKMALGAGSRREAGAVSPLPVSMLPVKTLQPVAPTTSAHKSRAARRAEEIPEELSGAS